VVIHLAAPDEIVSAQHPIEALRAGGEGTWNVLDALAACEKPPLFLYLSTFHVYGPNGKGTVTEDTPPFPVHPYSVGRFAGETVTQAFRHRHQLKALCVRASNIFGAPVSLDIPRWSLVFNDLCLQAVKDKKLILKTSGVQKRNFIAMMDAVRALEFLSLHSDKWPLDGTIHLGSSLNLSIVEAANHVAKWAPAILGYSTPIEMASQKSGEGTSDLDFSIARLVKMGFAWKNSIPEEIQATLKLCQKGEPSGIPVRPDLR
jgi:UDP-glucose 4-epimerase